MVVVDAHCHASEQWSEPIESLLFQMDHYAVDRAALIQIRGQFDNRSEADRELIFGGVAAAVFPCG
jgi:hypothetical protein